MIRKFFHMVVLSVVMLSVAATPMMVQADIFLRPNGASKEKAQPKKNSFRNFFLRKDRKKKPASSATKSNDSKAYYKKRGGTSVVKKQKDNNALDPDLFRPGGREPENARELAAVAFALKKPKLDSLSRYKAEHRAAMIRTNSNKRRVSQAQASSSNTANRVRRNTVRRVPQITRPAASAANKSYVVRDGLRAQPQERQKKVYIGRKRAAPETSRTLKKPRRVFNRYSRDSE